jgi:hypothetical protein
MKHAYDGHRNRARSNWHFVRRLTDERGKGEFFTFVLLSVIGLAIYGGYRLVESSNEMKAPKAISADGVAYLACRGQVSVTIEGGGLLGGADIYQISFIDAAGLFHNLRGIHKVEISDIPKLIDAPMPLNPGLVDSAGNPLIEGREYTWPDGSKALYKNGHLEAVKVPTDVCSVK